MKIIGTDFEEIFSESYNSSKRNDGGSNNGTRYDTNIGAVTFINHSVDNQFFMLESSYHMKDNVLLQGSGENSLLELQINLSKDPIYFKDKSGTEQKTRTLSSNIVFLNAQDNEAQIFFNKETDYHTFDIHLPIDFLQKFAGQSENLDHFINEMYSGRNSKLFENNIKVSSSILDVIHQIQTCTFEGLSRTIYMESKAYELLACIFEASESRTEAINHNDIDKIYYAAAYIQEHLYAPPTIMELSKIVGMNQSKLKHLFKKIMGNTVFGYLQQLRMSEAKRYLQDSRLSIEEIGILVGYKNVSNFSAAFKNVYGVSPSRFRK